VRPFPVPEIGLSSTQVWQAVLEDLQRTGKIGRANVEAWLRPSMLVGRGDRGTFIVGTPNGLARKRVTDRFAPAIAECLADLLGIPCAVEAVVAQEWLQAQMVHDPTAAPDDNSEIATA
jgi:chromosomal replication initiation ATPase DnaA